ncbi:hypothetical protein D3C72_1762240 [compost metagenome]
MVRGAHRGFPGRAFVQFAVRHGVVDEGRITLVLQSQRDADPDGETLAQGSSRDFHARRIGRHAGHGQTAIVAAIGVELAFRDHAGLDQRRVMGDRIVAVGQEKAVTAFPLRIPGPQVHGVAVGHGQHVGPAERLADVPLALDFAHADRVAADAPRGGRQFAQRLGLLHSKLPIGVVGVHCRMLAGT